MAGGSFGDLVRHHREAAGLTQEELAERAGLTVNGIGQLERGERRFPYPHTVRALVVALGLDEAGAATLRAAVPRRRRAGSDNGAATAAQPTAAQPTAAQPTASPAPVVGAAFPMPAPALVGREAELEAVAALLAPGRIVTLTGPGGVGKTALAAAVAASTGAAVVFVSLAAITDPQLVLPAIARALGVRESDRPLEEVLVDSLAIRARLLVLDNLEQVLDAAPLAARLVEGSRVTALATSRAPLRVRSEQAYPLDPLALPAASAAPIDEITAAPAAALLIERARGHAPAFTVSSETEAEAVRAICRRLDGLPLALELAAGWLRLMPPSALLERLDRALPMLESGARDLPERQRTLRSAIGWSEALLDEPLRVAFRRLAALASPWTPALGAAAAEARDETALLMQVAALEEASLVISGRPLAAAPGRAAVATFGMLETIREYGRERLEAAGETQATRERVLRDVRSVARGSAATVHGPDQAAALAALDAILPNLREAFAWLVEGRRADEAAGLGLDVLWFWFMRGHLTEGRRWMEHVLALGPDLTPAARMRALAVLGTLAWQQGQPATALAALDEAVELAGRAADRFVLATALLGRAWTRLAAGDLDGAEEDARTFEIVAVEGPTRAAIGFVLAVRVHVLAARGHLAEAAETVARLEASLRQAGGAWGMAFALNMRAMVVQLTDSDAAAVPILRESIPLSRSIDDLVALFYAMVALAGGLVRSDPEGAARLFGASEALGERVGLILSNPSSIRLYERQTAELAERLDPPSLERLWAEGRESDLGALLDAHATGTAQLTVTRSAAANAGGP